MTREQAQMYATPGTGYQADVNGRLTTSRMDSGCIYPASGQSAVSVVPRELREIENFAENWCGHTTSEQERGRWKQTFLLTKLRL